MSTTVLDALMNAKINFETAQTMGHSGSGNPIFMIAMEQLNNAIKALENDRGSAFVIQENMVSDIEA